MVIKSGRFGRFLACPGYPECTFTKPLVIEMPGRCPKCGGRLLKRTGLSKKTGKQFTYYACEHVSSHEEASKCDFMSWDVPVKDDCPVCGQTMFKKPGKGFKRPYCINPECANFVPEEKRGYVRKKTAETADAESAAEEKKPEAKKRTAKKTEGAKKPAAKKTAKSAAKSGTARKTAAKAKAKAVDVSAEDFNDEG